MLPLHPTVQVIEESIEGLVALNKPNGILSHPNSGPDRNASILNADYSEKKRCYQWRDNNGSIRKCFLINRLDSTTSGVILLAREEEIARQAIQAFEDLLVKKTYYALLFGTIPQSTVWKESLNIEKQSGQIRVAKGFKLQAITDCKRIFSRPYAGTVISLAELSPKTGRTHQLRCHAAIHKAPIIGDQTYGNFSLNRQFVQEFNEKRLFLHSAKIEIKLPSSGSPFFAEAPIPESFLHVLGETKHNIFTGEKCPEKERHPSSSTEKNADNLLKKLRKKYSPES